MALDDLGAMGLSALAAIVIPILNVDENPSELDYLFRRLGYDLDLDQADAAALLSATSLGPAITAVRALDPNDPAADPGAILTALEAVIDVIADLDDGIDTSDLPAPLDQPSEWPDVAARLIGLLLADAVYEAAVPLWATLVALGVIRSPSPGVVDTDRFVFDLEAANDLLSDPAAHLDATYGITAANGDDHEFLLTTIRNLAQAIGLRVLVEETPEAVRVLVAPAQPGPHSLFVVATTSRAGTFVEHLAGFWVSPLTDTAGGIEGVSVLVSIEVGASDTAADGAGSVEVRGSSTGLVGVTVTAAGVDFFGPTSAEVDAGVGLRIERDQPIVLLGTGGGTRLEVERAHAALDMGGPVTDPWIVVGVGVGAAGRRGLRLVIDLSDVGLVASAAGASELVVEAGVTATWSSVAGFGLNGSAGLRLELPTNLAIGPLSVDGLVVALEASSGGIEGRLGAALGLTIGPVDVGVDQLGITAVYAPSPDGSGSFGSADLRWEPLLPTGLSLAIDAGAVKGGGSLAIDRPNHRYTGTFELAVSEFRVTAVGLVQTHLPAPGPEYSVVLLLGAEFPGVSVGFGLTLNGISGLVGLHRTFDAQRLREDVVSGAIGQILSLEGASTDPGRLLAAVEAVFPARADHYVLGIGVQLRWIGLVRFDLMIGLELPGPARIVLLGSVRAELSVDAEELLRLRLDVVGLLDLEHKTLSIDAALIDSSILAVLRVEGGAAVRMSWGSEPYLILSVGGFHPDFVPEPAVLPVPRRVGMSAGKPGDLIYYRLDSYFAVTTNTVQFGGRSEIRVNAGPIEASGTLGFDVLILIDPFAFAFDFRARFRVTLSGRTLSGASIKGTLSGPGPLVFRGKVCIEILFFDACWSGSIKLGSSVTQPVPSVPSVVEVLRGEIVPANLSTIPDRRASTTVELGADSAGRPVVAPDGRLTWTQSRAPFELPLERFEGAPLAQPLIVTAAGSPVDEWFAPASFATYNDAEAIDLPAFERLPGGIEVAATGPTASLPLPPLTVKADEYVLPDPTRSRVLLQILPSWLFAEALPVVPLMTVQAERWQVFAPAGAAMAVSGRAVSQQRARLTGHVAVAAGDAITVEGL